MARMTDVDVDYISLVKKGANKQKIQIYKADEEPETSPINDEIEEVTGFFNAIKSFFTKEVKVEEEVKVKGFNDRMATREVMNNIWKVNDTLVNVMRDILLSDMKNKEKALKNAIDEHGTYLKARIEGIDGIKKAEKLFEEEGGNEEMKKEDLQEIIKEAIEPLNTKIQELEKEMKGEEIEDKQEETITKEDIAKAVKEAIEPLNERIKKIENFKGISKQLDGEEEQVEKSTSVFAGIDI